MLLNFHTQWDLSRRQARWMEELAIYDCKFVYIKGELNTVADSLSRFPFTHTFSSAKADLSAIHPSLSPPSVPPSLLNVSPSSPLSCVASLVTAPSPTSSGTTYSIEIDNDWVTKLCDAYRTDPWCFKLLSASQGMPDLVVKKWIVVCERLSIYSCKLRGM